MPTKRPGPDDPKTPSDRRRTPKGETVKIGDDLYTMSAGAAEAIREAIAAGTFTGFRSLEDFPPKPKDKS